MNTVTYKFKDDAKIPAELTVNGKTTPVWIQQLWGAANLYGARTPGTKCRDCFNVVGVDTEQGLLKTIRIGNNTDIYLCSKNALCYDYVHKKLIRQG